MRSAVVATLNLAALVLLMLAVVPDVKQGNTLTFSYLPGKGTTLHAGTKELDVLEGKGFADVVFAIWLGPKPPSEDLKKGMLG